MKWLSLITLTVFLNFLGTSNAQSDSKNKPSVSSDSVTNCYICNENLDERCRDPFKVDSELVKPCENGETFCRKIIQTVEGKTTVVRQCAKELYKPDYEGCYKTAGKASQTVCTCRGDKGACNVAHKQVVTSMFALVTTLILSFMLL